jgi:stage II sporulation protein D
MHRLAPITVLLALAVPATADAASRLEIRGAGFGHGVGMSQYGALGQASVGRNYRQILGHYYTDTSLARLSADPTVRVLLQSGRSSVVFTGAAQAGDRGLKPDQRYSADLGGRGITLRSATGRRLSTFSSPLRIVGPGGAPITLIGGDHAGTYRGAFELRPAQFGGLNVINAVGLEDYIRGVVPVESPASWPIEALKAQAVAARTYAITTTKGGSGWDHYPDTRSQVYGGVRVEARTTDAAVARTRREVVTYRGRPVVTYFFSTSGGRTENAEFGFVGGPSQPWLKSVSDPWDRVSPKHRWGPFRYTPGSAATKLGGLVKGSFRGIKVTQRGISPRVVRAEILGTRGRTAIDGPSLRTRFGLDDTWAYFAFVDTRARAARAHDDDAPLRPSGAFAASAYEPGVVRGTVVPGGKGTVVRVERRTNHGWIVETRTRLGSDGRYAARVSRSGVYRVTGSGFAGPTVRLK